MTWFGASRSSVAKNGKTASTAWDAICQIDVSAPNDIFTYEVNGDTLAMISREVMHNMGFLNPLPESRKTVSYHRVVNDYSNSHVIASNSTSQQFMIDDCMVVINAPSGFGSNRRNGARIGKRSIRLLTECVRRGVIPTCGPDNIAVARTRPHQIPKMFSVDRIAVSPAHVLLPAIRDEVTFAVQKTWNMRSAFVKSGKFELVSGSRAAEIYNIFTKLNSVVEDDSATIAQKLNELFVSYGSEYSKFQIYDTKSIDRVSIQLFANNSALNEHEEALIRCYENNWPFTVHNNGFSTTVCLVNETDYVLYRTMY